MTTTPHVLSISDRAVDEARSIHQHHYDNPLAPARGFFYGILMGAVMWSIAIAVVAWFLS